MTKPLIMGIVNVTPDSFSDGGKFFDHEAAIAHGLKLIEEGADILDIGGESTRPGAETVSIEDEITRVVPVIRGLASKGKLISVDTRHTKVMRAAIDAGAGLINDIAALQDEAAVDLAAKSGVSVCLMHMQGEPQTMQANPQYEDVVEEVFTFLKERINVCLEAGIARDKIYADIGIGFGKTLDHNLELFRHLDRFHELEVKLLLGASRKKFIENIAGPTAADQRIGGSLAAALWGYDNGIEVLRVHDVAQTKQAIDVWERLSR